ncbi:MAG: deoxyribodipyrimidine photo-lyase, partial [Woeseiaceae bacterium]
MSDSPLIVWFRQDLRLEDNPALTAAARQGRPILPVYILDDINAGEWRMGAASRWWLHQSLRSLNASLDGQLLFLKGDAQKLLPELAAAATADTVYWNRRYEPWAITRDTALKEQ